MDTKHIHCMLEKIAEYGKQMMEEAVGAGNVNLDDAGKIVDMVKDLACAEKDALIAKEMRKAHEDEEAEEKYIRKMLKEENKDEYKRMREEYGEDEGERRFYDNYRYKRSGRFAPKGRGSYMPRSGRRGYEEPMYFLPPEVYMNYSPEELRDMDRDMGRMYYGGGSGGSSSGNSSGQSGNSGMSSGNMGGGSGSSTRGYSDGYDDGQRRGYEDGYRDGESRGRSQGENSRYDRARRGYEEKKEMNKGNSPQENSENMKGLEELLNVVGGDVKELTPKMSPSEKAMTAQKFDTWSKMLKQ